MGYDRCTLAFNFVTCEQNCSSWHMYHNVAVTFTHYAVYTHSTCRHKSAADMLLLNMWQFRVEIKHYSIVCFDHVTMFEVL